MCGIAGYFGIAEDESLLKAMNTAQAHRGPDGNGVFTHGPAGLAHVRLAFIDRDHGQQPVFADNDNLVLIYNGEVYNFLELRAELQAAGRTFKTNSDTEVVLQAYAEWGMSAFDRFNGMFALAIYNKKQKQLVLARDHFGIKPLYFTNLGDTKNPRILFASEIKTLLATKKVQARPNDKQIYRYLRFRIHEDSSETFFDGIYKLLPGEAITIGITGLQHHQFSRLPDELAQAAKERRPYTPAETAAYRQKLEESVRIRLISEVPVGTCLSGGLDSSTLALTVHKLIKEQAKNAESVGQQQNTFSAVFPGSINDEEKYIDAVLDKAAGRMTSHKIYPTADSFVEDLADFIRTQEEPTISTGPYAQYKVMQEAQNHVRALLHGQGADEMMAGYYPYYFVYLRQLRREGRWGILFLEVLGSADVLFRFLRFRLYDVLNFRRKITISQLLRPAFKQN